MNRRSGCWTETALSPAPRRSDLPDDKQRMIERMHSSEDALVGQDGAFWSTADGAKYFRVEQRSERRGMKSDR